MTREEIKRKMDALLNKYVQTLNQEIIEELFRWASELDELRKRMGNALVFMLAAGEKVKDDEQVADCRNSVK